MYSSGKFLVPITIVGLAMVAGRADPANSPITIATPREIANAAFAALRVCFLITGAPFGLSPATLCVEDSRCHDPLQREQRQPHRRRERHDAVAGAEHAFEAIARLVDDHRAEPAAAGDRRDR